MEGAQEGVSVAMVTPKCDVCRHSRSEYSHICSYQGVLRRVNSWLLVNISPCLGLCMKHEEWAKMGILLIESPPGSEIMAALTATFLAFSGRMSLWFMSELTSVDFNLGPTLPLVTNHANIEIISMLRGSIVAMYIGGGAVESLLLIHPRRGRHSVWLTPGRCLRKRHLFLAVPYTYSTDRFTMTTRCTHSELYKKGRRMWTKQAIR